MAGAVLTDYAGYLPVILDQLDRGSIKIEFNALLDAVGDELADLLDAETAKMMASMEDYDNLKRDECMAFGREVLAALSPE